MILKKKVEFELSIEEEKAILVTAQVLREVCGEFSDCLGCPFVEMCDKSGSFPFLYLEDFVRGSKKKT